jgi:hypothetical protein
LIVGLMVEEDENTLEDLRASLAWGVAKQAL